jgi:hypothetical protein
MVLSSQPADRPPGWSRRFLPESELTMPGICEDQSNKHCEIANNGEHSLKNFRHDRCSFIEKSS